MSYRLKLTITISLLIALSFGIGGTLMISTSFQNTLDQETQTALNNFESIQNTLYLFHTMGGSHTRIRVPWPGWLCSSTEPPCSRAQCLTMASPRPVPPVALERLLSTR